MSDNSSTATAAERSSVQQDSAFTAPQITLPKGGGAIRGIGEKFAANAVTGTGSLTVPIAISPGRSGFGPQLSLSYDSGTGNGPFGIGWSLSLPAITRKTDKGLPRYRDAEESDVFILSGSEDLVPVLKQDSENKWVADEFRREGYKVKRYRPRIEGLFARIERWTRLCDGDVHWRSISNDNILTVYGSSAESRIFDPADPRHIFSWLISRSYDDRGNAIIYEYASENDRGIDLSRANERNRTRTANRYLKRIKYGNRKPLLLDVDTSSFRRSHLSPGNLQRAAWMFEVVFDYGDGHYSEEPPDDRKRVFALASAISNGLWFVRKDPFSTYRAGFEVRNYRLCTRVLMFHHFPDELGVDDYLVSSTGFEYHQKPIGSFITSVTQSGYKRRSGGRYLKKSLPPVELKYTASPLEDPNYDNYEVNEVDTNSLANLPGGIDSTNYRWTDLDGEGISGVLTEQGDAWFYKPNLGRGHFGPVELVTKKPSLAELSSGRQELLDIAGDGKLDLVQLGSGAPGYYERTRDAQWGRFRTFGSLPIRNFSDPNLKFVDVTGDGIADVLIAEDNAFTWHPSLLQEGFGEAVRTAMAENEEEGPRIVFADGTQSIYFADMSGDGMSDIVRIRNGEICYWPNLGYGRFGAKLTMDNSPRFDEVDQFDQTRIRLADTDGSGTTDILYFGRDGMRIYLNEAGNSWSASRALDRFPTANDLTSISVVDFLGRGTACVLWSSSLLSDAGRPLRYVDLMAGQKPHLLTKVHNNLGTETVIEYASSTEFYLADKAAGKPWVTRLPFPVHVVKRVETYDYLSRNRFVTCYKYHDGYFDGVEREFRGFAMIEQFDTEEFAALSQTGNFPTGTNVDAASYVPPALTKTWFHTGAWIDARWISRQFQHQYYREGQSASDEFELEHESLEPMSLEDTRLPPHLAPDEAREACRSLKGAVLRQEVYAIDDKSESARPYTVSERNYVIRPLQRKGKNRHAVFFTHPRETVTFNYERKLFDIDGCMRADPRVAHTVTLKVDQYGNVLTSVAVAYGRRFDGPSTRMTEADRAKQKQILATLTESSYTNAILEFDAYRPPLLCETRTFELLDLKPDADHSGITNLFRFDELAKKVEQASDAKQDLPFENLAAYESTAVKPHRRLIANSRTLYRSNKLARFLPLGTLESLALAGESYKLAFTSGLVNRIYWRPRSDQPPEKLLPDHKAVLRDEGGYVDMDCQWWIPSGRMFYSPKTGDTTDEELAHAKNHFFLAVRFRDPFGNNSALQYDSHDLALIETRDAVGSVARAVHDYRALAPRLLTDANQNRSEVAFDSLGMVVGTAVMGKKGEHLGDSLENFNPDMDEDTILKHISDPLANPHEILAKATTCLLYDLFAFVRTKKDSQPQPVAVYTLSRETHESDLAGGQRTKIQHALSYSDGFGREIQKKIQAEPGPVVERGPEIRSRWVGSGWTIFNSKGKPVRQYEPFFSATHTFEFATVIGVSPILFYDPVGRVIATLHPNQTYEKVVFDPWRQETWDVNDTLLQSNPAKDPDVGDFFSRLPAADYLPTWCEQRREGTLGLDEQTAAQKTELHAGTPNEAYMDPLGRTFLTIAYNRHNRDGAIIDEYLATRLELDIQGNQRSITDALGRKIMVYDYNLLGNRIHQSGVDAGQRWILNDAGGKPLLIWDSREHRLRQRYDALRRPTDLLVQKGDGAERIAERVIYGEEQPDNTVLNLRGKVLQAFDGTGVVTNKRFDFKGNLLNSTRQLLQNYKDEVDWAQSAPLEAQIFTVGTVYDALNRPVALTTPDASVTRPTYNEANLLEQVYVNLRGATTATPIVLNVDYNAKGQRELIEYGNGARTQYHYDPKTSRLVRLKTTRKSDHVTLQDLNYVYDPIGNITAIKDDAQETIYFNNQVASPANYYLYDALYRLIKADGREHIGQVARPQTTWDDSSRSDQPLPTDGQAMRRYRETYEYDGVGNILKFIHSAANGNWRRQYVYDEPCTHPPSNRLTSTRVGEVRELYEYDPHGNMTRMSHLPLIAWDFKNQLHTTQRQVVSEAEAEKTYYIYDSAGQRVRKITENPKKAKKNERVYLGGFEIYREFKTNGELSLQRETLHVMDGEKRLVLVEKHTHGNEELPSQLIRYQFSNHLGSASLELDDNSHIISYEEYYPFGSTSYGAVRSRTETPKRYRISGKERDLETGFSYHGARYYAPWLGRWTSCDPSGLRDSNNLFSYVGNNPVNKVDLTGNWEVSWTDVAIGAAVAVLVVGAVVVTAGVAAGPLAAGLASAGLTAGEISTLGTAAVAAGTAYGVVGTATTVNELATGINSETGQPLTDVEGSRRLGALPVQLVATALGVRGIAGGGGGAAPPLAEPLPSLRLATPQGFVFGSAPAATPVAVNPSIAMGTGALTGTGAVPLMMSMMGGGGSGGGSSSGGQEPKRAPPNRERAISKKVAELELRQALETEKLSPRQLEVVQLIRDEYGPEAIEHFIETGTFPEGTDIENSHPYSIQTEPELASRPGDLVPRQFHRSGVHAGDTSIPLEGDPLAPNYAEESGFTELDENGEPIGQMGVNQVDENSNLNMCLPRR